MTLENFTTRINWRQILIHFVACWFFIYAFLTLSFLFNLKVVNIIRNSGEQDIAKAMTDNGMEVLEFFYFQIFTQAACGVGLLVGFIISLVISIKRRWFWVNSLIAFVAAYLLWRFDLLGWTYVKTIFWYPGKKFNNTIVEFLMNGMILLAIGLLIFLSKRINLVIAHKRLMVK